MLYVELFNINSNEHMAIKYPFMLDFIKRTSRSRLKFSAQISIVCSAKNGLITEFILGREKSIKTNLVDFP